MSDNTEILSLLARLGELLTKPEPPKDPPGTINGHSIEGDEDGFATVPAWPGIFAEETRDIKESKVLQYLQSKMAQRLDCESIARNCKFPSEAARQKARLNLSRRRSTIAVGLGGDSFTHDALLISITPKTKTLNPGDSLADPYWDVSPETRATRTQDFKDAEVLKCENGKGAWAGNWNPAMDVAYFNDLYRAHLRAEIAALKPSGPSVGFG